MEIDWHHNLDENTWIGFCGKKKKHEMKVINTRAKYKNEYKINNRRQLNNCTQHETLEDAILCQALIVQKTTFI